MRGLWLTATAALLLSAGCGGKAEEKPKEACPPPPPPAAEKEANPEAADFRELPAVSCEGGEPLLEVLAARRSTRDYGDRTLTAEEVAHLLWAGQGITAEGRYRTAPSAGALYPMTVYYADDVALWRYEPKRHGLAKVADGDVRRDVARAGLEQAPLKRAPGIIVIVAKPAVAAAKYGDRAERYCMLEAGHIAQNILLTAQALGLGACPVGAFRDGDLLDVLGLGDGYLPLYLIPVGEAFEP
jgi:SagB-type dehydrogenase family enzyme